MRRVLALTFAGLVATGCGPDFAQPAPYTPPPLEVTSFTPTSGAPGELVTLTGSFGGVSYYDGGSLVIYVGGLICIPLPGWTGTRAQFRVPQLGAGTYPVQIEISFGELSSIRRVTARDRFTVLALR